MTSRDYSELRQRLGLNGRPKGSAAYDAEDGLHDAIVERLEAEAAGTEPPASDLASRAQILTDSADRIARRRRHRLTRIRAEVLSESGTRQLDATPRANGNEETRLREIDYQRFKQALQPDSLTIVQAIEDGKDLRTIAKELGVSKDTVQRRLRSLTPLAQRYLKSEQGP